MFELLSKLRGKLINLCCSHDFDQKEKMFVASRRCIKCGDIEFCILAPTLFGKSFEEVMIL